MTGLSNHELYLGTQHYNGRKNPSLIARYGDREFILGSMKNGKSEKIMSLFLSALLDEIDLEEFKRKLEAMDD